MNAKEIRETIKKHANKDNSRTPEGNIAYWSSSCAQFLSEIAAQLAEQNEKLNILLNPPLLVNVPEIGPEERLGFSGTPISFMAMEPRETLRDKFAMSALAGLLSDPTSPGPERCAEATYRYADSMMEARK